jgi:hypothetical protein
VGYPIIVSRRARVVRLLLIVFGSGALLLFVDAYARRAQVAISLRSAEAVSAYRLEGIVNGPTGRFATLCRGVFYAGSDKGSDYVVIPLGKIKVQAFKTRSGELAIQHRIKLTCDERRWIDIYGLFPWPR